MSLEPGDRVVGMEVARPELDLLVVSQNGYGKRTAALGVSAPPPRRQGRPDHARDGQDGPHRRPEGGASRTTGC